jgi:hypothetical protein
MPQFSFHEATEPWFFFRHLAQVSKDIAMLPTPDNSVYCCFKVGGYNLCAFSSGCNQSSFITNVGNVRAFTVSVNYAILCKYLKTRVSSLPTLLQILQCLHLVPVLLALNVLQRFLCEI